MSEPSSSKLSGADFAAKISQAYSAGGYERAAYEYVFLSIRKTIKEQQEARKAQNNGAGATGSRHINAATLVSGLVTKLRDEFGYLANDVMRSWGLSGSADVGEIVFRLAAVKLLSLSPDDSRSDFCGLCDFSSNGCGAETPVRGQKPVPLPVFDSLLGRGRRP